MTGVNKLNPSGQWVGVVDLMVNGLWAAHFTNAAQVRLLWREPGMATNAIKDADRFVKS